MVIYYFSLAMETALAENRYIHNKRITCCHNETMNQRRPKTKRLIGVYQRSERGVRVKFLCSRIQSLCLLLKVISCLRSYFFPSLYPGPSSCTLPCWPPLHIAALSNLANAVTSQANQPPGGTSGQAKRFQLWTVWTLHVMTNNVMSLSHSLCSLAKVWARVRGQNVLSLLENKLLGNGMAHFLGWDFTHSLLTTASSDPEKHSGISWALPPSGHLLCPGVLRPKKNIVCIPAARVA